MKKNEILVFESNLAGNHNSVDAMRAVRYYGAIRGRASGIQGRCYALPTSDWEGTPLKFRHLKDFFYGFFQCAEENPELIFHFENFNHSKLGLNLQQVKELFTDTPVNIRIPNAYVPLFFKIKREDTLNRS